MPRLAKADLRPIVHKLMNSKKRRCFNGDLEKFMGRDDLKAIWG